MESEDVDIVRMVKPEKSEAAATEGGSICAIISSSGGLQRSCGVQTSSKSWQRRKRRLRANAKWKSAK